MWPNVSARERRTLLGGVAVIAALIILSRGVPAWGAWQREAAASAAERTAEAGRARALVDALPALRDSLASRQRMLHALKTLVLPGSPSAAAGALMSIVSDAVADAGLRLGAVHARPDSGGRGVFTRVAVRGTVVGDVAGVVTLLQSLEGGHALLSVRELSISQPEPAAGADRAEALHVEFVVEGFATSPWIRERE